MLDPGGGWRRECITFRGGLPPKSGSWRCAYLTCCSMAQHMGAKTRAGLRFFSQRYVMRGEGTSLILTLTTHQGVYFLLWRGARVQPHFFAPPPTKILPSSCLPSPPSLVTFIYKFLFILSLFLIFSQFLFFLPIPERRFQTWCYLCCLASLCLSKSEEWTPMHSPVLRSAMLHMGSVVTLLLSISYYGILGCTNQLFIQVAASFVNEFTLWTESSRSQLANQGLLPF